MSIRLKELEDYSKSKNGAEVANRKMSIRLKELEEYS